MTLKENSNGDCFAAWLQEYKARLQQVHVQGNGNNGRCATPASSNADAEQQADEKKSSLPAAAGETYGSFQPAVIL
jgi:hypothetical protein